jgi:two-component system sensor histidine kinase UhpB
MLDDLGLVPALRWYAKEFKRRTGAQISVREQGEAGKPPSSVVTYLFRAIKELSNNSLKHGRATEVCIGVHWHDSTVRAVIDDNGSGFDPAVRSHVAGLGLAGIRERATTLGGELQLESAPGKGCRAILQLPLMV